MNGDPPTIICPRCLRRSAAAGDILHGYCGHCHDYTSKPGGSLDPSWPLPIDESTLEPYRCPVCPWCGWPPVMFMRGPAQAFCGNDECQALTWDARMTPAQIIASATRVALDG